MASGGEAAAAEALTSSEGAAAHALTGAEGAASEVGHMSGGARTGPHAELGASAGESVSGPRGEGQQRLALEAEPNNPGAREFGTVTEPASHPVSVVGNEQLNPSATIAEPSQAATISAQTQVIGNTLIVRPLNLLRPFVHTDDQLLERLCTETIHISAMEA